MRILLVTPEFPPHVLGGLGRYSGEVTKALVASGATVDVLVAPSYFGAAAVSPGAAPSGANVLDTRGVLEALQRHPPNVAAALSQARMSVEAMVPPTDGPYDIAYVQDYASAPVACALLDLGVARRICAACHLPLYAGFTYFERSIDDDVHQVLESLLIRRATWIIAPSRFTRSVLLRTYSLSPERVHVIPLGVARNDVAAPQRPYRQPVVLGTVARFTEQKGLHYLPRLLNRLNAIDVPARLCILGSGTGRDRFEAQVAANGMCDRIEVLAARPHDEVWAFYDDVDIFVSTSLYETFGLAPLEAMASAKPTVAFGIAAHVELYGEALTPLLCPVGDIATMADTIADLVKQRELPEPLRRALLERAAMFNWGSHARALLGRWEGA